VRVVIARCSVDYSGRLTAHLPPATRLLIHKNDGSVLIHSDGGSYKPLNWMAPPCSLVTMDPDPEQVEAGVKEIWRVTHRKTADLLVVSIYDIVTELTHELGDDPGLIKDGVEAQLQVLVAAQLEAIGVDMTLIRREFPTAIGPVDILAKDPNATVAIEIKRRGDIDGVEQLTRYVELLNRDPSLSPVRGVLAAQDIAPQAKILAKDRGIECVTLDYDALRGADDTDNRLF
jgi:RecB family endonuclease NucS